MNSSIYSADATTHLKIVLTALLAASIVVWVGIAARISAAPIAASATAPAQPSATLVQPSPVPTKRSVIAMANSHRQ